MTKIIELINLKKEYKTIELINLKKEYKTSKENLEVLKGINYSFEQGKLYAIKGHSGSGKTTLVRILGLMDDLTSGEYLLYNKTTKSLSDRDSSYYRMKHIVILLSYETHWIYISRI